MNEQQKQQLLTLFAQLVKAKDDLIDYCAQENLFNTYSALDGGTDCLCDTLLDFKEVLQNLGIEFEEEEDY